MRDRRRARVNPAGPRACPSRVSRHSDGQVGLAADVHEAAVERLVEPFLDERRRERVVRALAQTGGGERCPVRVGEHREEGGVETLVGRPSDDTQPRRTSSDIDSTTSSAEPAAAA